MSYTIRLAPAAEKFLEKLRDKALTALLADVVRKLADKPLPSGCEKLTTAAPDLYRVRVGKCRVIYQVRDSALLVLVLPIGHRRDIYRS